MDNVKDMVLSNSKGTLYTPSLIKYLATIIERIVSLEAELPMAKELMMDF